MTFDPIQLRVLGALIEKEITTPENYPLSLNALIAACNQRSSRDPVFDLTEDEVRQAVHSLEDSGVVTPVRDARVPKYEHRIRTVLNLRRDETAILCLLLLRGPQTTGELRSRADRMYSFDDLAAVQSTLERLANRGANSPHHASPESAQGSADEALVLMLPRQPGARESRYAHLLGGPVAATDAPRSPLLSILHQAAHAASAAPAETFEAEAKIAAQIEAGLSARIESLESAVAQLQSRLEAVETLALEPAQLLEPPAQQV